jgi:hypothetical protein
VQQHAAPINDSELLELLSVFAMGKHEGEAMARTTLKSRSGRKLYAKRSKTGQFEDIQSYRRAQGQDIKRSSAAERAAAKKKATKKKSGRKTASKKRAA